MLTIAICDDEAAQSDYLAALSREWAAIGKTAIDICVYGSAESLLFEREGEKPADIFLLDIQMKGIDGVRLAKKIRENNGSSQIIFITGYPDFIAEGYEVSALNYLMKPVGREKLFGELDRAVINLGRAEKALTLQTGDGAARFALSEILYIEAFGHGAAVVTKDGPHEVRDGIGGIEASLDESFVKCHRSYIVGIRHVKLITKTDAVLDDGAKVPLSRRLYAEVNRAFIDYYKFQKNPPGGAN